MGESLLNIPFPTSALPNLLEEFVGEVAESVRCDASFVALPALSALATLVGNTRVIQIRPGWTEPCVIWSGLIAEPGGGKSPAIRIATQPLIDLQSDGFGNQAAPIPVREPDRVPHLAHTHANNRE